MSDLLEIAGNEQSIGGTPVTAEAVAHLPDAEPENVGIGPLSAHVAILSRRKNPGCPEGYAEYQLRQALSDAMSELGPERVNQIIREAAE